VYWNKSKLQIGLLLFSLILVSTAIIPNAFAGHTSPTINTVGPTGGVKATTFTLGDPGGIFVDCTFTSAGAATIRIYRDSPRVKLGDVSFATVGAGSQSTTFVITDTATFTADRYLIGCAFQETGSPHNDSVGHFIDIVIETPVPPPDLIIDKFYIVNPLTPTTDDLITINAVVKNVGTAQAPSTTLEFRIGGESPGPNTKFTTPVLNPDDTWTKTRQITLNVAQNYLATATADVLNAVAESNENNNIKTLPFSVILPPPDTIPPEFNTPPNIERTTTDPSGTTVSYSLPSARISRHDPIWFHFARYITRARKGHLLTATTL